MLLKSEFHSISGQSPRTVGYDYDAMGNRTSATIASPATAATLTRRLTWGQDLAGSPSLQGAGGVGGLLMVEEITSTTNEAYHFHYDGNGNVTEITDHLGASVATYRYDAFGNTLVATGTYAATNRYRFSTKPLDHEVTTAPLYYYGYRYLDPVMGRWLSRDPIGEAGGVNLYGFVGNDAVNHLDSLGLTKEDCEKLKKKYEDDPASLSELAKEFVAWDNTETSPDYKLPRLECRDCCDETDPVDQAKNQGKNGFYELETNTIVLCYDGIDHNRVRANDGEGVPFDEYATITIHEELVHSNQHQFWRLNWKSCTARLCAEMQAKSHSGRYADKEAKDRERFIAWEAAATVARINSCRRENESSKDARDRLYTQAREMYSQCATKSWRDPLNVR